MLTQSKYAQDPDREERPGTGKSSRYPIIMSVNQDIEGASPGFGTLLEAEKSGSWSISLGHNSQTVSLGEGGMEEMRV